MNPFKLCLFAVLAAAAAAAPQGGYGSNTQPQRQRKCEWRNEVEYVDESYEDCKTAYQTKCDTLYRKKCTPYQDEECETYQRRQCDQKTKTWYEEVCVDKYKTHCEKHWETDAYGAKHWVDDKSTCKQLADGKDCKDVQRQEPYEDCYNVPDKKCRYVTRQSCKDEPYEECKQQPYRACEQVHKQVPKQRRVRYCDGKRVGGSGSNGSGALRDDDVHDGGYNAQSVSDTFDQLGVRTEEEAIGTKEVGTRSEGDDDGSGDDGAKDGDAITFGR